MLDAAWAMAEKAADPQAAGAAKFPAVCARFSFPVRNDCRKTRATWMKVSDLRGILNYVPRFREKIFVIAVDGEVAASPNFSNVLLDLAVLRSLNVRIVLAHGAGHQIGQLATDRGVRASNTDGTGITDEATLKVSLDAATTLMNDIMQGLTSVDLRAAYANVVIAHPAGILGGVDQQHTGRVERVDTALLQVLLNEGVIP
jgi:amino-acid N-acetyltransferase